MQGFERQVSVHLEVRHGELAGGWWVVVSWSHDTSDACNGLVLRAVLRVLCATGGRSPFCLVTLR